MTTVKDLVEYGREARLDAEESAARSAADELHQFSMDYITRHIPYWRRYYLRKNQPRNYFRITRIIPPDLLDYPQAWIHKFQVWTPDRYKELAIDELIRRDVYEFLSTQPDWEPLPDNPDFFVYRNPNLNCG